REKPSMGSTYEELFGVTRFDTRRHFIVRTKLATRSRRRAGRWWRVEQRYKDDERTSVGDRLPPGGRHQPAFDRRDGLSAGINHKLQHVSGPATTLILFRRRRNAGERCDDRKRFCRHHSV